VTKGGDNGGVSEMSVEHLVKIGIPDLCESQARTTVLVPCFGSYVSVLKASGLEIWMLVLEA
jgi:hypothetical protein